MHKLKKIMAVVMSAMLCLGLTPAASMTVSAAADEQAIFDGDMGEESPDPDNAIEGSVVSDDMIGTDDIDNINDTDDDNTNDAAKIDETVEEEEPEIRAEAGETIVCDISKGSVTIGNTDTITDNGSKITYTDGEGVLHTGTPISSRTHIVITGTTYENTVMIRDYDNAPLDITFKDLTIDVSKIGAELSGYESTCAVYFGGESTSWPQGRVNLTLEGANTIKSLDYAGIAVPMGETLKITGEGSLDVSSEKGNAGVSAPAIGSPVATNSPPAYISNEKYDSSFGTIIINGGKIHATSDSAAIGGGQGCAAGNIVINGGDITAEAGESSSAGIGCGQDSAIGSILITGGTVNATGSNSGPGIGGGGMHTDSGIITIKGGDITATGGDYAPGIGGSGTNGSHGNASQIHIYGGTVRSYGGAYAPGIGGGGPYGVADDIWISGGVVYAHGGAGSAREGEHKSRVMVDGKMTFVVDGTSTEIRSAGAGIGNGGAVFSIVNYTSGDKAGQTVISGTARFGGAVRISGGEVHAYRGAMTGEEMALIENTGYTYTEAQAIGNGGYVDANIDEENPYEESARTFTGGNIYENDLLVYPAASPSPSPSPSPAVKIPAAGTKLTDTKSKAVYKVIKKGSTVSYIKTTDNKAAALTIPSTVTIGKIKYKVTSIAPRALKGNTKLKSVTIAGNVSVIGAQALQGCSSLTTVTIGANVSTIGKKAFYNCKKLQKLTVKTKKLTSKKVGAQAFTKAGSSDYKKLKVTVPSARSKSYKKIFQARGLSAKATVK